MIRQMPSESPDEIAHKAQFIVIRPMIHTKSDGNPFTLILSRSRRTVPASKSVYGLDSQNPPISLVLSSGKRIARSQMHGHCRRDGEASIGLGSELRDKGYHLNPAHSTVEKEADEAVN